MQTRIYIYLIPSLNEKKKLSAKINMSIGR